MSEAAVSGARNIDANTPEDRCLVWVADRRGGGQWAIGRVLQFPDGQFVLADGYSSGWDFTHWTPLPPAPE